MRQYFGLAVRCRRHNFLPMMNNLFVKFREMASKIKKVIIVITLKEVSATNSKKNDFGIYFHGASEVEHSRFTQVSFIIIIRALSKRTKSFMPRPPSSLFLMRVVFFILAGFCFQIKSNTILLTSVAKFFGVSITLEMNTSLERKMF